ncbi:homocysteine S-methyltransferase family protein [Limibaculum sp. M0105]|uniref:Homocysteine S-methyltransferase family protein n=1 Tax=Thermohalobaculum xanthum TaxID=2753746 RepID=A0A8J7SC63_9RHOB|nr:homocysteine S-methyltransferase family protein [Thermohalobaculum xanthum]MBK0399287.1 homocysteine S-methyltransferase family protein [Thermohalobaculum xanthum]
MSRIVLTDGGMGQELLARTGLAPTPLWSAQVMREMPEAVEQLHLDYIRAGARVITVNAYSAEPCRLQRFGVEDAFSELQQTACRLALRARDRAGDAGAGVRIAGCLPPLEWSYVPELARSQDEALPIYDRVVVEQAPHVDLFLCETMAAAGEAAGAARAAAKSGKPVWVSWTVSEERQATVRSGEPLADAIAALGETPVAALLVNCSSPEAVGRCMTALSADGRPFGGYANGFTPFERGHALGKTVEDLSSRTDMGPAAYAGHVMRWIGDGATIVGGCCETNPAHIAEIARRLAEAGDEILAPECAP